jgi:surface protein
MAYTLSSSTFSISSPVVIKNGTEGYGKILTTDASGLVVWKEPNSFFGTSRYIGELYGGGIVVDYWKEGDVENTLIMSLTHLSYDYVWSNIPSVSGSVFSDTSYSTNADSLYDGKYNSNLITSQIVYNSFPLISHTISAAKLCKDYNYAGYEDWYLPSYNEFNSIIKNKHIINRVLGDVDGIRSQNTGSGAALSGLYWTSTEFEEILSTNNIQYALQYSTSESKFKAVNKTSSAMVRAIRREEKITGNGLVLSLDAGNKNSYDDSTKGNVWYDLVNKGVTASAGLTFSVSATGVTYSSSNGGYFIFKNNQTSFIDFKANLDNTTVVTVEMFARLKNTSGNIFTWGSAYSILDYTPLGFWTGGGDTYGLTSQMKTDYGLANTWKHYIFVMRTDVSYTNNNNKIYVNGDQITLVANGGNESSKNFVNGTGRINPPNSGLSNGAGMDLAIFNVYKRELNKTEIVNNFNRYKKRFETKETVYQKDIILNVNSNNINSFNPTNLTTWNDTKFTSDTRTLKPLTFASTATYSKSPGVYPGTSINFDGINRASVATTITFTYSTTWETWVKFDSFDINPFNMFMGQIQPYFSIRTTVSNKVLFSNSYSGIVGSTATQSYQFSNSSVVANVWYHLAFTTKYDSVSNTTSSKIYINGLPDYSNVITTNGPNYTIYDSNSIPGYQLNDYPSYKFTVGDGSNLFPFNDTPTWYPFRGSISEVRIYNRTLSATEIENNYNSSKHLYNIDKNHYTHNFNTSPTFSIFQNLTLDFPNKQNNSILVSDNKGLVSLDTPTNLIIGKTNKKSVGDLYAGGIIVSVVDYLSTTNYLIASLQDLTSTHYWSTLAGSQSVNTNLNTSEFDGSSSTGLIKTGFGVGSYAAMTASTYNYGGYTDWYLPSSNELREAYNNSNIINLVLGKNSLIDTYWSSTESVIGDPGAFGTVFFRRAFAFNFGSNLASYPSNISGFGIDGATSSGLELAVGKYNKLKVRPFRREIDSNSTEFITVWKTDNSGTSGSNSITIPINTSYTYNYNVDWGDGTTSTGLTTATTKTYTTAGTYTVKITGDFPVIRFGLGDKLKLLQVKNWGSIKWSSMYSSFSGCSNLTITALDAPDLSNLTDMGYMFNNCWSLNQSINHWDVSNVENMIYMFLNCITFNKSLNSWNVSKVTNMSFMFANANAFNQPLNSWDTSAVINMSGMFQGTDTFNNGLAPGVSGAFSWNTSAVEDMQSMFKFAPAFNQSLTTNGNIWNVSNVTNMSSMFQGAESFNQPLNSWNTSAVQHMSSMFDGAAVFNKSLNSWNTGLVINMSLMFYNAIAFNNGLAPGVSGPLNFDTHLVEFMSSMFNNTTAFNQSLTTSGNIWNVSKVTNMSGMFYNATSFNQPLNSWILNQAFNIDMSNMFRNASVFNKSLNSWNTGFVIDMSAMFYNATAFNNGLAPGASGPLNFHTNKVTNMSGMFAYASSFNQSLTTSGNIWNTSVVINMSSMFQNAIAFNNGLASGVSGPLNFDTRAVINMSDMFSGTTAFNQSLTTSGNIWNTSVVQYMTNMFYFASVFNQPLNSWNVSSVKNMDYMFRDAPAFNQPLTLWNVSSVTSMFQMFCNSNFNNGQAPGVTSTLSWNTASLTISASMFVNNSAFNANISSWPTNLVINMSEMFQSATAFNQPLATSGNSWNTSAVTNMSQMFYNASAFNQPLNSWNTSAVTNMDRMFSNSAFNQPLNLWNVALVTNMNSMFSYCPFNQNIGGWVISNVTNFSSFMSGKNFLTLSTTNLNAIYIGWAALPSVKPNISIDFGSAKRTAASTTARNILTSFPKNWSITDGGI